MPNTQITDLKERWFKCAHTVYDLMPQLTEAELRIMLVVQRKILGWHKPMNKPEPISLSQFTRETGMAESSVERGIQAAVSRGWLIKVNNVGPRRTAGYILNLDAVNGNHQANDFPQDEGIQDESPDDESSTSPIVEEETPLPQGTQKNALKKDTKKRTTQPADAATEDSHLISEEKNHSQAQNQEQSKPTNDNVQGELTRLEQYIIDITQTPKHKGLATTYVRQLNSTVPWTDLSTGKQSEGPCPNELFETDPQYGEWIRVVVWDELKRHFSPPHRIPVKDIVTRILNYRRFYDWSHKNPPKPKERIMLLMKSPYNGNIVYIECDDWDEVEKLKEEGYE